MAGAPIAQCRKSIMSIMGDHLNPEDTVRVLVFSTKCQHILNPSQIGPHMDLIRNTIERNTNCNGSTAFYEAVLTALSSTSSADQNARGAVDRVRGRAAMGEWIVALTDGEDNSSGPHSLQQLVNSVNAFPGTLIVITVGALKNRAVIENICKRAGFRGVHIPVGTGAAAIGAAFERVASMLSGQMNVETL